LTGSLLHRTARADDSPIPAGAGGHRDRV